MNRLKDSNSPYLLQHVNNPVDWYPWGEEALTRAREEDKVIFLSIGYAACHWCHVMAHESFEDEDTAAIMNALFVNIKVDREERPDIDSIYMNAVVAMTGQGGWPMSMFLTPAGEPFFGGTYFPPTRRYRMPAFTEVLQSVERAWREDRQRIYETGRQLRDRLQTAVPLGGGGALSETIVEQASMNLAQSYDWQNGGWGQAPKFPQPMTINFLLRRAQRGDKFALDIATNALDAMAKGGMYDLVGGGFSRYSVDNQWLVPHFEKMLYDNAQLAVAYLNAYLLTGKKQYRRVCEETLDFVQREMTHPDGGFFSSLDADSEGEEGKFYVWSETEIAKVLQDGREIEIFKAAYGVTSSGNFEGHTVLQRALDDSQLSENFDLSVNEVPKLLGKMHKKLLAYRSARIRPDTDDKVLVGWNALMSFAYSEAGKYLNRFDYTELAMRNNQFVLDSFVSEDGRLLRSWRDGKAMHNAYLEDYAALIMSLISLYYADPDNKWYSAAATLANTMIEKYSDPNGGFFDTSSDHETLIVRPKDVQDNAIPSGNALAATALLHLTALTGDGKFRDLSESALIALQDNLSKYPTAFGQWLCAYDFALGPVHEIAILFPTGKQHQPFSSKIWKKFNPRTITAVSEHPPAESSPPLLADRPLLGGKTTAYVCQNFFCKSPVNTPSDLEAQLNAL